MSKIAIISPYAPPEKGAVVLRLESFRKFFEQKGFEVEILSPERKGVPSANGIIRYRNLYGLFRAIKNGKPDLVIGTSPPMTDSFFAMLLAKITGKPFVLDIRDPWTESIVGLGIYKKNSFKIKVYRAIERISYRFADRIFVVTGHIKESMQNKGVKKEKLVLVENGTEKEIFRFSEKEREKMRKQLGLNGVTGIYAGSFASRELDEMLLSVAPLIRKTGMKLMLVIPYSEEKEGYLNMKRIIKKENLEKNIIFADSSQKGIPFNELYKYFSAADFGIVTLNNSLEYCIPVKTYDYVSCGLKVIAKGPENGALRDIFQEKDLGIYSDNWKDFGNSAEKIVKMKNIRGKTSKISEADFGRNLQNEKAFMEIKKLLKN